MSINEPRSRRSAAPYVFAAASDVSYAAFTSAMVASSGKPALSGRTSGPRQSTHGRIDIAARMPDVGNSMSFGPAPGSRG